MNETSSASATCLYAIKLATSGPADIGVIAGRLEHVLSGRRHDFTNGAQLLAWLANEQAEAYSTACASLPDGG